MKMLVDNGKVKLYNNDNDYVLELWGSSTKHPDYTKTLSCYENSHDDILREYRSINERLFYFLTYVASEMLFIQTARQLLEIASNLLEN